MNTMKKVYIRTFGCQMNMRDSEFVMGLMLENGFGQASSAKNADIIIFNSCSVRKHAEDRLFSNIAELKELKKNKPGLVIGLMGCTAQAYKTKALERAPLADFVCGPGDEFALPRIVKNILKDRYPIIATDRVNDKRPELFPRYRQAKFKAYVSISEGCDNFCSYCVVPYVRGRERSRSAKDVIREVEELAERGFREITLLGQNVNSFKGGGRRPGSDFVRLLEELNKIKGISRIRFMTSHPKDASADLFRAMKDLEKVCEHLHLPLQSGSDRILKLMNRGYTSGKYLKLAESYKKILPEGSITTDVIVGFPSETEGDFKKTVGLMNKIRFDSAFTFKYSPRPFTRSAGFKDDVKKETKDARLMAINDLQVKISEGRNGPLEGRVVEVLVDGQSGKAPSKLTGRTRTNKVAVFDGNNRLIGSIARINIISVTPYTLKGRVV